MTHQKQGTCVNHGSVLAQKQGVSHVLHFFLSLFTGGLWLLVWFFLIAKNSAAAYRCPQCGIKTS